MKETLENIMLHLGLYGKVFFRDGEIMTQEEAAKIQYSVAEQTAFDIEFERTLGGQTIGEPWK